MDERDEIRAVWEDHLDEDYRRDQSHWRGQGRWDDEHWLGIGRRSRLRIARLYQAAGRDLDVAKPQALLEWGPGGGSNLLALAGDASTLFAVDISKKNLEESGRVLREVPGTTFVPIHLVAEPDTVVPEITTPIDLFLSTAVFQHFPSPEYGHKVLEVAHRVMAPHALGYVQIRFDNGNPKYAPKPLENYREKHITANSYELSQFWDLLVATGFQPIQIADVATANNYASFYFVRR